MRRRKMGAGWGSTRSPGASLRLKVRDAPMQSLRLHTDSPAITVAEIVDAYLNHQERHSHARTQEIRRQVFGKLVPQLGDKPIADCIPADLLLWAESHLEWKSDWTIQRVYATVQACFNWAARLKIIPANPFAGLSHSGGQPRRPMTEAEFNALMSVSGAALRRVLQFLRWTGCRPGELANLRWEHLDIERSVFILPAPLHKTGRKTKRPRFIVMPDAAIAQIKELAADQKQLDGHVFVNSRGGPWRRWGIAKAVKRARQKAGIKGTSAYGIRHKFINDAVKNRANLRAVAELVGHAGMRSIETYIHIHGDVDHLRGTVNSLFRKQESPPAP